MRHIQRNNAIEITASSSDGNFPASNLLNDRPRKPWKAGGVLNNATLEISCIGSVTDLAIFGTNATTATVSITDPNQIEFLSTDGDDWGDGDYWINDGSFDSSVTLTQNQLSKALWAEFAAGINVPVVLSVLLIAPGNEELYGGVLWAGFGTTYGDVNPSYGLGEKRDDFSIVSQNSNGTRYYKKRNISRIFDFSLILPRTNFYELTDSFDELGAIPTAWKLTDIDDTNWLVYGYSEITGSHDIPNYVMTNINLTEVV